MLTFEVTSTSKQMFFLLERCFDFNANDRSMFDPLTFDPAYLNAVVYGAQAYLDLVSGRSSKQTVVTADVEDNTAPSPSNFDFGWKRTGFRF